MKEYEWTYHKINNQIEHNELTGVARSVDLPFVGNKVLENKKAKLFWVFEGSLQNTDRISNTVLSCMWTLNNPDVHSIIFEKYWAKNRYDLIRNSLPVSPEIAEVSYVVDSVRVPNQNKKPNTLMNRELLLREIKLLNPDLVILVGGMAKYIVGNKLINDNPNHFHQIPFPTNRRKKSERIAATVEYKLLFERLQKILL